MNKVILIMIVIVMILTGVILGASIYRKEQSKNNINDNIEIAESIVDEEIYDDCTDEGETIANDENDTLQVNSSFGDTDKTEYVLRDENGVITVFKVEDGKEIEYDSTDIATAYLAEEDKNNLQHGITVYGEKDLNQLLEDFE